MMYIFCSLLFFQLLNVDGFLIDVLFSILLMLKILYTYMHTCTYIYDLTKCEKWLQYNLAFIFKIELFNFTYWNRYIITICNRNENYRKYIRSFLVFFLQGKINKKHESSVSFCTWAFFFTTLQVLCQIPLVAIIFFGRYKV